MSLFANTATTANAIALFPKTVADMQTIVADAKARTAAALEAIYSVGERTFVNTARATDLAEAELDCSASIISVVKSTSPSKELREEARKHLVDLEAFAIDSFSNNKKLYKSLQEFVSTSEYKGLAPGEKKYWIDEEISEMKRSGLELEGEAFDKVVELQKKISDLGTTFETNVAEDSTELYFAEAELEGTPAPIVGALAKKEGDESKLVVKLDYPTYFGIMKNCTVATTRKAVAEAFENRAFPSNLEVLKDVIRARHQLSTVLGYSSFSAYNLENKMIKTPANAAKFIEDLIPGLQKKWEIEKQLIIDNLHPSVVLSPEGDLYSYDIAFSINHIKQSKLNVSETEIQKYFPMDSTVKALFDIYQSFFDITFVQHNNGKELWHEDVSTLEVIDNNTKAVLGYVVLDLFPREGKFSHACCASVVPPCERKEEDGVFTPALTVVIANFPKATKDAQALFMHDDVETFFHEFGHAIHGLMGRSKMCTFAGTRVKRDFVELPSQMLEEWLWDRAILQKVSKHYQTGKPLPDELIDAKIASQNAFSGRDSLRQLQFAQFSLQLFNTEFNKEGSTLDTTQLYRDIQAKTIKGLKGSDNGHFECAFGHLMGYGAGYYGYMWSEVLAQDVFNYIKERDGLLSPELGKRYVKHIIGPGGSRDPNVLVREFLEREPSNAAFLAKLGITQ